MSAEKMDSKILNVEVDRLSSLPDELIHKILSFIDIKHAIETSALSSRWRFLWTSMPYLEFSNQGIPFPKFSRFIAHFLSHRNNIAQLFSIKLNYFRYLTPDFVKQMLNYAFSHNIQQLDIKLVLENDIEFPLSVFNSLSVKHLSLSEDVVRSSFLYSITATSTWELPALTTLNLHYVTLCDDNNDKCVGLFSKCVNLKNLTLVSCKIKGTDKLSISHPRLTNLTLENDYDSLQYINLVTPQLKTLTIKNLLWESYQISAPELVSLSYSGSHPLLLSTNGFHSLEKVDLCVYSLKEADAPVIVRLFRQFQCVKFLRLNMEILELLSSYLELISRKPSPFAKLKSLKIYPVKKFLDVEDRESEKFNMSIKTKNYLLSNSPNATSTMVSREEIRDMKNTKLAQKIMSELQVVLEQEKAKTETNRVHAEQGKTHELHIGGSVKHINGCWKHLSADIKQGKTKTRDIISKLKDLRVLLKKLPTSKRNEMQPCFSSLCTEADSVVGNILDHMRIQCDMKRRCFSVYFNELASTS